MAVIIFFFSWLGTYCDKKFETATPWWTLCLSLFGVIVSMFLIIREVLNMTTPDE